MAGPVHVMVEAGPRRKRFVASAFDWPGWDRGAKTEADALATLEAYRGRYAPVARLAGLADEFAATGPLEIVQRQVGMGMTDFYTMSCRPAAPELEQMSAAESERKLAILRAAWTYFDAVAGRVSGALRAGPRGGGRDRDTIMRHANGAEIYEWANKVGVDWPLETRLDPERLRAYRGELVDAIREHNANGRPAKTWTIQYLIRRCCYHMLDHAWEMEDRDLTAT